MLVTVRSVDAIAVARSPARTVLTIRTTRGTGISMSCVNSLGHEWLVFMSPKSATSFGRRPCEFSISTVDVMSAGHVTANVHIGDFPMPLGR